MYEKRRDWDKLVAVHQRDSRLLSDRGHAPAPPRRGRQASASKEKLKKPTTSDRPVEAGPDGRSRGSAEALADSRSCTSARKAWGDLGDVLQKQVAIAGDATKRSGGHARQVWGFPVHGKGPGRREGDRGIWQALLADKSRTTGAPRTPSRSSTCNRRTGTRSRRSTPPRTKWDELVRVARAVPGPSVFGSTGAPSFRRRAVSRASPTSPTAREKAFEKALSIDGKNLVAAEALIPLYEKAKDVRRLADALLVQLDQTTARDDRHARIQRLSQAARGDAGDRRMALVITLRAFDGESAVGGGRARRRGGIRGRERQVVRPRRGLREGAAARVTPTPPRRGRYLGALARAYEKELANPDAAMRAQPEDLRDGSQGPLRRSMRFRAPLRRDGALRRPPRDLRQEACSSLAKSKASKPSRSA